MRTTLDIDEAILEQAMEYADGMSKKALVETALEEYVNARRRESLVAAIQKGDLGIDLTIEELRKMRGCP
ncbi:MAG: type II toxin-antitoxin system VapB family antitoxin [Chloroflexi bacterium]|nr:MAG: type II toxin-antitoxin system VapB family antitoxin [Chloroflexota bacterium]TMG08312.1 MAG: type II toxin-antitoxin system VapB family antitoxin [Chloroflexota bacterium]